jgi:hypothetical protein
MQRRAARYHEFELRRCREQFGDDGRGGRHAFEVVEHDEHGAIAYRRRHGSSDGLAANVANAERQCNFSRNEYRIRQGGELDVTRAPRKLVCEFCRNRNREGRLSDAWLAGDRKQSRCGIEEKAPYRRHLGSAPDQRYGLGKSRARVAAALTSAAGCRTQPVAGFRVEAERLGDQRDCNGARPQRNAGFDVADRSRAHAGTIGKLLL